MSEVFVVVHFTDGEVRWTPKDALMSLLIAGTAESGQRGMTAEIWLNISMKDLKARKP